jgi:N-acyl-phosphatidylethanolamine-hydrolysing phospholipase D
MARFIGYCRTVTRSILAAAFLVAAALIFISCQSTNPMFDPNKPHHTAQGFRNNYPTGPRGSFWKWQRERWDKGLPKIPEGGYHFEQVQPDLARLKSNRTQPTLTWIGHATFLLQLGGLNILTDAHLTERASPLSFAGPRRVVPPAIELRDLPHIDAVVVSHSHYDHLDRSTVKRLASQAGGSPRFFVPLGLKAWFAGRAIREVTELDWWDEIDYRGLKLTLVPVQHWSARTPWDRDATLWGGWVVEQPGFRFLFTGDTGYSQDFQDIGRRFGGFDLAAIPIGAYEPRWFMGIMHVNPEEAVKIHRDIRARASVAMHWGTFILTDEPLDEPPRRLAEARRAAGVSPEEFFLMKHGETMELAPLFGEAAASRNDAPEAVAR